MKALVIIYICLCVHIMVDRVFIIGHEKSLKFGKFYGGYFLHLLNRWTTNLYSFYFFILLQVATQFGSPPFKELHLLNMDYEIKKEK